MNSKLLIIEDDRTSARKLQQRIEGLGYPRPRVIIGKNVSAKKINEMVPDLILVNAGLKTRINGIRACGSISNNVFTPIIYFTDQSVKQPDSPAYFSASFREEDLRLIIENALVKHGRGKKLIRINSILYSIRRINHHISRKKDREQLIKACCKDLVRIRGYIYVCVLLLDTNQEIVSCISAGAERVKSHVEKMIKQNMMPPCYRKTFRQKDVLLIRKPSAECGSCFLQNKYEGALGMSIMLQFRNSVYGVLKITMNRDSIVEQEERNLLQRLASDIGYAFNKLDIEENHRRFMEKLQQSEQKFRCLLESLNEGIWVVDKNSVTTYVNPRMAAILGYSPEEMMEKKITDFLEPGRQDGWNRIFTLNPQGIKQQHVFKFLKKDDSALFARITLALLQSRRGAFEGAIACVQDITEQHNLERELLELSKNEEERLARTLHDSLGQLLTGVALKNKVLENRLKELDLPEWRDAENITGLINQAVEQTRMLAKGLLYFELGPDSFISGIKELIITTEHIFGVRCLLECDGSIEIGDRITGFQLYMIIREAVHNAVKHGRATQVKISIVRSQNGIVLEITDNGSGRLDDLDRDTGLGLGIMRHRAHMINAALDFFENSKQGLKLRCVLAV
jgi:PAS domain S-box-containing protein